MTECRPERDGIFRRKMPERNGSFTRQLSFFKIHGILIDNW